MPNIERGDKPTLLPSLWMLFISSKGYVTASCIEEKPLTKNHSVKAQHRPWVHSRYVTMQGLRGRVATYYYYPP